MILQKINSANCWFGAMLVEPQERLALPQQPSSRPLRERACGKIRSSLRPALVPGICPPRAEAAPAAAAWQHEHRNSTGILPDSLRFESGFLQQRVRCEPDLRGASYYPPRSPEVSHSDQSLRTMPSRNPETMPSGSDRRYPARKRSSLVERREAGVVTKSAAQI